MCALGGQARGVLEVSDARARGSCPVFGGGHARFHSAYRRRPLSIEIQRYRAISELGHCTTLFPLQIGHNPRGIFNFLLSAVATGNDCTHFGCYCDPRFQVPCHFMDGS